MKFIAIPSPEIPQDILDAAKKLSDWAAAEKLQFWQIFDVCDRRYSRGRIQCPNPACQDGSVDTGGTTPWGTPINDKCGWCDGLGHVAFGVAGKQ